jgi:predicted ATPase
LLRNPNEVLKEFGISVDSTEEKFIIHENTKKTQHLTLVHPSQISEEELTSISRDKFHKAWAKITIRAWHDEVYKQRAIKNAAELLRENGIDLASAITYQVHENTQTDHHLTLMLPPELSEMDLKSVSGGSCDSAANKCAWDGQYNTSASLC